MQQPENLRVVVTRIGAPVELVRDPAPRPGPGQVRIAVEAAGVSQADITIVQGMYPEGAAVPFTLGYDCVGRIDALGDGVRGLEVGRRVAAITVRGSHARYLCWAADDVWPVPEGLAPDRAVCLLLNYMTAYQLLHRAARVQPGEKLLVTSAAGGVGTALLQLARLVPMTVYGTASTRKLALVESLGGIAIDYTRGDFTDELRRREPGGLDVALDAVGGRNFSLAYATLRRGGRFVGYGFTSQMHRPVLGRLDTFGRFALMYLRPDGRKPKFYGIMFAKRARPAEFRADLTTLFELALAGKIDPIIADRLPLAEAPEALRRVSAGEVQGKLVLVT